MDGQKKTGVSIMLMNEGLDTGDILTQEAVEIPLDMNFGQLHDLLAIVGADLLIKTIPLWQTGEISPLSQAGLETNYAALLKKEDEKIHWTNSVGMIYNQIRGLSPKPGAYTVFKGNPLKIKEGKIYTGEGLQALAGTVLCIVKGQGFVVQAGNGSLLVKQVQPMGKIVMSAPSFMNGYHLEVGDIFDDADR
jgi:methionyl-tRNA formyltransferase